MKHRDSGKQSNFKAIAIFLAAVSFPLLLVLLQNVFYEFSDALRERIASVNASLYLGALLAAHFLPGAFLLSFIPLKHSKRRVLYRVVIIVLYCAVMIPITFAFRFFSYSWFNSNYVPL